MNAQLQTGQTPPTPNGEAPQNAQLKLLPPPGIHQSTNPSIQSAKPRARNGKIARLPYLERDMVNRMLRDNIPHPAIAAALDEHGFTVTVRNISNWKTRGGYKQWCAEVDRALENRILQDNLIEHLRKDDASQLPEIGLQRAATHLSQFLLSPQGQQQLATDPQAYSRTVTTLCRLANQIHTLQRYRDDSAKELGHDYHPERIKREDEREVELTRSVYSAAKLGHSIHEPDIPRHNYMPKTR